MDGSSPKIWEGRFPLKTYFESENHVVFLTCASWPGIRDLFELSRGLTRKITFITLDWGETYQCSRAHWEEFRDFSETTYFLSNDHQTHSTRTAAGLKSFLINHNCWLNENIFDIKGIPKLFDAIVAARAKKWKRIYLARKVRNLALVVNRWGIDGHRGENDDSYKTMECSYLNDHHLSKPELCNVVNQSKVGLLLSTYEGASYTSSIFLLCGLPVVSTQPEVGDGLGGREYWYNEYNSILCAPTEDDIKEAVDAFLVSPPSAADIRYDHIRKMTMLREEFVENVLRPIFDFQPISGIETRDYFYKTLFYKDIQESIFSSRWKLYSAQDFEDKWLKIKA